MKAELNGELVKVFVTNNLKFDNYVLVTNLTVSGTLYDELKAIFDAFQINHPGLCKNFGIISYRDLEDCLENNPKIVWRFLNLLNHADFELLFNTPFQRLISTRSKGWFQGIAKRVNSFVYTQQIENSINNLKEYHIIILTGPSKSGKTFTAEMIALYYFGEKGYEAVKIDDPDEVEKFYNPDKRQIFVCDDAFGSHILSYTHADDWNRKLETVFNLADADHNFVFSSRENIYQAFTNYAKDFEKDFLPKTTIASDDLTDAEKGAILDRYVQLSNLPEAVKEEILVNEDQTTTHANFSPESIRAFFRTKLIFTDKENAVSRLLEHLNNPNKYLRDVFYKLGKNSQAAVLSVLCAPGNTFSNVQRTFANLRSDLEINDLAPTDKEFDELNGAILKVTKDEQVEAVNFYHPSMQEFLIREVGKDKHGNLRKTILKNLNSVLIRQFLLELPNMKDSQRASKAILISDQDLKLIKVGIERLLENEEIRLYDLIPAIKWISSPETGNSKIFDKSLFTEIKQLVDFIYTNIFEERVFKRLKEESATKWMNFLQTLKTLELVVGRNRPESVKKLIIEL